MTLAQQTSEPTLMRFHAGETLAEAIDRVTDEQFDIALRIADAAPDHRALAVHSTRKALKRLRAMLRLVRDMIAEDSYSTDNQVMKLVAAELSGIRDTWVMAETLGRILPHSPEIADTLPSLLARLETMFSVESQAALGNDALMASIIEQLENVKKRSSRWTAVAGTGGALPHEFRSIRPGLERVYKRGRRGMQIVQESPTDTLLHVWRKRAKYLRHQVEALNILDPAYMQGWEDRLTQLTDLLGDDHDLAVLTYRLAEDASLREGVEIDPVRAAISNHRHQLQAEAIALGEELFADPAKKFLNQLERLWPSGASF